MEHSIPATTMGQRFKKHLERAQVDLGETDPDITESLHGLRAGGALFMALSGKSLADRCRKNLCLLFPPTQP